MSTPKQKTINELVENTEEYKKIVNYCYVPLFTNEEKKMMYHLVFQEMINNLSYSFDTITINLTLIFVLKHMINIGVSNIDLDTIKQSLTLVTSQMGLGWDDNGILNKFCQNPIMFKKFAKLFPEEAEKLYRSRRLLNYALGLLHFDMFRILVLEYDYIPSKMIEMSVWWKGKPSRFVLNVLDNNKLMEVFSDQLNDLQKYVVNAICNTCADKEDGIKIASQMTVLKSYFKDQLKN